MHSRPTMHRGWLHMKYLRSVQCTEADTEGLNTKTRNEMQLKCSSSSSSSNFAVWQWIWAVIAGDANRMQEQSWNTDVELMAALDYRPVVLRIKVLGKQSKRRVENRLGKPFHLKPILPEDGDGASPRNVVFKRVDMAVRPRRLYWIMSPRKF
jgi:hypothetical protein